MPVLRLDHVQLAMPPAGRPMLSRSMKGSSGSSMEKPPHLAVRGGCWFETAAVKIHLGVENGFRAAKKAHPAVIVDDVRALAAALELAGHVVVDDEPLEGYDRVYVSDLFGNRLELVQPM
ncbi:MAG: glyoxalase [Acidimicrobiia bacterium]|nr:glyoxalase [Acidimicrobiia bacterium]